MIYRLSSEETITHTIAQKNRCSVWNRILFVSNLYEPAYLSYGLVYTGMQKYTKMLLMPW